MTLDEFRALVERSGVITPDKDDRAERLTEQLAATSVDEIVSFETHLTAVRRQGHVRARGGRPGRPRGAARGA